MRLATDRSRTDIKACFVLHLPKIGSHKTSSSNGPLKIRPSWIYGAGRFRRFRHCCRSGLASGVSSLCRLGNTVVGFLHVRRPWLSWASSSLGHSPSRALASRLSPTASRPLATTPHARVRHESEGSMRSASSGIPGKHPLGHRTLCFKFQRSGKLAYLLRGCRSLEVSVLVPAAGVSDRPFACPQSTSGLETGTVALFKVPRITRARSDISLRTLRSSRVVSLSPEDIPSV
jgi:hypothetical protein